MMPFRPSDDHVFWIADSRLLPYCQPSAHDQGRKFDSYCWRFVDGRPKLNRWKTTQQIPARSLESEKLSKDLKDRGFNFVGPTVAYAYMQAIGMVNDHTVDCFRYREITREFTNAK
jgi:3-methyladenine DNA glycosylase Tag